MERRAYRAKHPLGWVEPEKRPQGKVKWAGEDSESQGKLDSGRCGGIIVGGKGECPQVGHDKISRQGGKVKGDSHKGTADKLGNLP